MRVSLYFDVYPWTKVSDIYAWPLSGATKKLQDAKRYQIDIEIPDPIEPDEIIQAEAKERNHEQQLP